MKRILLTGHRGFIGQHMYRFLEDKGCSIFLCEKDDPFPSLPLIKTLDAVIHLGATTSTMSPMSPELIENNFCFSQRLLEMCHEAGVMCQYASSAAVYGSSRKTPEDEYYRPLNAYGLSKYMTDLWASSLKDAKYQGFRYFNVYHFEGEEHKQGQASPVFTFLQQAKRDGKINLFHNSSAYCRDFVNVEDICRAHWEFLNKPQHTGIFNFGTGRPVSFETIAKTIAEKTGAEINHIQMPMELWGSYQKFTKASVKKFRRVLPGFKWQNPETFIHKNVYKYI